MWQSQSPLSSSTAPFLRTPGQLYRGKHKHDELDEDEDEYEREQGAGRDLKDGSHAPFPISTSMGRMQPVRKRRRNNKDSEAALNGLGTLSLEGERNGGVQTAMASENELSGRRGLRGVTPFPELAAASLSAPTEPRIPKGREKDAMMERHDPSRPHVVFVDTLSDTDDDGEASLPSVTDDEVTAAPTQRPIRINKRLRDQLRQQQALQAGLHPGAAGPLIEEILANSTVQERGLVLYRPLTWGIVEEIDDEREGHKLGDDYNIEEISDEGQAVDSMSDIQGEVDQQLPDISAEMDLD